MVDLLNQLRSLWQTRRHQVDAEFKRHLPFGDYVVDRWEKARALGFGEGASVYDSAHIFGDVSVGGNSWIGPFTILDGSGGLSIGSNCSISAGVQVYSHDTVQWAISGGRAKAETAPTRVGNNCYVGPNTVIAKGVTIGDRSIVGAGSVVTKSIPEDEIWAGNPACFIKKIVANTNKLIAV